MEEARAHEARIPGPHALLPLGEVWEGRPGQPGLALQVVVHAHEARGATGGRRAHRVALEHGDPGAASGQVEGEARTLDPGAHDDDVGRWLHRSILDCRPTACRPTLAPGAPYGGWRSWVTNDAATRLAPRRCAPRQAVVTPPRPTRGPASRFRGGVIRGAAVRRVAARLRLPCPVPGRDTAAARRTIGQRGHHGGWVALGLGHARRCHRRSSGYRSAGSPGYAAAADAVATSLRASGWTVSDDAFTAPTFTDDGGSSLDAGGQRFGDDDIRPLIFAPAGDVTGPVVVIDWLPGTTARDGKGCRTADYGDLPDGAVVLVRPGPCYRRDQVLAAQAAGAAAFVAGYGGAASGAAPRATLIDPGGLTIPAIGATGHAADALASVAETGGVARVVTTGRTVEASTRSIIAELPGSEPASVVMLGAHLDWSSTAPA